MLNKMNILIKASFLQLRLYLYIILGIIVVNILVQFIVGQFAGSGDNTNVSSGNMLLIILICMAVVLPVSFYKRIINLGASRKEYYTGLITIYTMWSALFALFNIVWLKLEIGFIRDYYNTLNILEVFHWDQFGLAGMFLYQFGTYMLLASLLNLLFSSLRHVAGWIIWVVLIAAIPIGTSIASLRVKVADGFLTLLFNDSLLQGFGLTFLLSCLFLAGGWWFTKRRTI
ncbi:hypothetical protein [Paenibacillus mendelii]|uniref:ABC transporter permease n=1 Tax=Paenibacillus mendelii TaxID=206163 RepID=A0ABV6J7N6_9BACL|nr:hypothetical protein [Paenibacillus mendelii]MCQ6561089.1 hypothetical protein [Paenibacillus mendelii]